MTFVNRTRALRVVLVIGTANPGGAEGQLVRLACELKQRGVDVRVLFSAYGGPLTERLDVSGVPWEVLRRPDFPPTSTGRNLAALVKLASRLVAWQPDVVFAWLAGVVWFTLPIAAIFTRAKRIAAFRGEVFDRDLGRVSGAFRSAVKHAHAITVNAPSLRQEAIRWGAPVDRVVMIANGVDLPDVQSDVSATPPTAVVIANFRWYKGHDVLMDALALVEQPLSIRLVGEGDLLELTRVQAIELGISQKITFVEHPADVKAELQRAQFAVHPSRTEGLSNAILEELAAGLPVVATDVGGTRLLVEDGVNGYVVPAGDPSLLAAKISELAASSDLRASLTGGARKRAETFTWDASTDKYLALFAQLTGRQKAQR